MRTWLTDQFGLAVPVVSAPMGGVAGGALAAAVSRAGALGMVGVGALATPDWVTEQCALASRGAPFGVGLQAWALERNPGQLDAALVSGAVLVSVSYGPYALYVDRVHDAGLPVATSVGNLREAQEAADAGVDVIVARGAEGGGHGRDDVGTLPLLQSVLDAVDRPVLAAGGIGSSRGLAAVVAAGAAGAWVGTAFLTCVETSTSAAARARLAAAGDTETAYGRVFDVAARAGWPSQFGERALRNAFYDRWEGHEDELAEDAEAARVMARARADEDLDVICLDAGQGVGLLRGECTAADVVAELAGATELLRRAGQQLGGADGASPADGGGQADSALAVLRRWEDSGGVWRVLTRSADRLDVALLTCDAREEMQRLNSADPQLREFIGDRSGSDET
jgi:nitronate monooxygenase